MTVLSKFGIASLGLTKDDFLQPGAITQIGYPPLRIDILNEIDGVSFTVAFQNKLFIDIEGPPVNIGLDDLIANKSASGRNRDLSDIAELNKLRKQK